jgi:hypothetical protein
LTLSTFFKRRSRDKRKPWTMCIPRLKYTSRVIISSIFSFIITNLEMKDSTIEALTSDVKARTGFFEFIKQNK